MDSPRRPTIRVNDPKVRQVGFFTPGLPPADSPPLNSPSGNSLPSPVVMIIPPQTRHAADNLSRAVNVPIATRTIPFHQRRQSFDNNDSLIVGSYNPDECLLGTSPASSGIGIGDEFSEDSEHWIARNNSGVRRVIESIAAVDVPAADSRKAENGVGKTAQEAAELVNDVPKSKKPLKEKTTKAERRALQEAQRAAKVSNAKSSGAPGTTPSAREQTSKTSKQPPQKKGGGPIISTPGASEKKGADRPAEKDRKKDVPAPRMQFDDKSRVEKAKRRSIVKQTEARNRVELFLHLPQYEHGSQLPDLESRFFHNDSMHPSVHKVGLKYLAGDIVGGNARCIAMLQAFWDAIKDYSTPPEKNLNRDLTAKINNYVSFHFSSSTDLFPSAWEMQFDS